MSHLIWLLMDYNKPNLAVMDVVSYFCPRHSSRLQHSLVDIWLNLATVLVVGRVAGTDSVHVLRG